MNYILSLLSDISIKEDLDHGGYGAGYFKESKKAFTC